MRTQPFAAMCLLASLSTVSFSAVAVFAQPARKDVIWARVASGPITLNGVLAEPSWALAESVHVFYGQDNGIPGSGFKIEQGGPPSDLTRATLKFLVSGNQLYMAAIIPDSSVGGSKVFNRQDGLLMSLKNHADPNSPRPPTEYFYAWWYESLTDPQPPGQAPAFIGQWATWPPGTPRDSTQIANWDAVTVVTGLSNSDATLDKRWIVEMRFNLTPMGYNVTLPQGDVVEWNVSVYDCDWNWPIISKFSANRVWWQSPWGNDHWYNEVRVHARPSVTVSSGPVPSIGPDIELHELNIATPVMDGRLLEPLWNNPLVYKFDIRYGDNALRATYPATGPYRAGQYQPVVNGRQAAILNPSDATVRMFFQGDFLYLGFDVRDQVVQYVTNVDRWDGFIVTANEYSQRGPDQQLLGRRLAFQVSPTGTALAQDWLAHLVAVDSAQVALFLKPGTSVDTMGASADVGYTAELKIDLRGLGYPHGLGDDRLFLGVNLLDGDSYGNNWTWSYGTRAWWFREYEGTCCPVWAYLRHDATTAVGPIVPQPHEGYTLLGSFPNPAIRQRIQFTLREPTEVEFELYDLSGRLVESRNLGVQASGVGEVLYDGSRRSNGIYFYRVLLSDPASGAARATLHGRMILIK